MTDQIWFATCGTTTTVTTIVDDIVLFSTDNTGIGQIWWVKYDYILDQVIGLIGVGLALQDTGMTDVELADLLLSSSVYKADALGTSNETFVKHVYKNVTGQTITLDDLTFFTGALDRKEVTQAQLLDAASNLVAFRDASHINLVGLADTGIEYTPFTL